MTKPKKIKRNRHVLAQSIISGETEITAGYHIGSSIDALISRIVESKRVMMSDLEYNYILSRVDALKEQITENRLWGL